MRHAPRPVLRSPPPAAEALVVGHAVHRLRARFTRVLASRLPSFYDRRHSRVVISTATRHVAEFPPHQRRRAASAGAHRAPPSSGPVVSTATRDGAWPVVSLRRFAGAWSDASGTTLADIPPGLDRLSAPAGPRVAAFRGRRPRASSLPRRHAAVAKARRRPSERHRTSVPRTEF